MQVEEIKTIAVIGAGLMGHGIAQEFALAGYDVRLNDLADETLQKALESIESNLTMLQEIGFVSPGQTEAVVSHIHTSTALEEAAAEADIVIESVFEKLELKQQIFQSLDSICPGRTILASNSSTLVPSRLASATDRPDKVLVAHYFNPPYLLPLVEIVPSGETSDETVATIFELMKRIGKSPALITNEAPGFVGNRLQAALVREAVSIVQRGIASPQDVDIVIKNGFGRRLAFAGIFETFDIAGLDLLLAAAPHLLNDIESSTELPPFLRDKVDRGELGVKTGRGFYSWSPEAAEELKKRIARGLIAVARLSA